MYLRENPDLKLNLSTNVKTYVSLSHTTTGGSTVSWKRIQSVNHGRSSVSLSLILSCKIAFPYARNTRRITISIGMTTTTKRKGYIDEPRREFRRWRRSRENDPVLSPWGEKKESLSWPDAIRRPEKRRGRGGYNGQNEIVLGHRGNVRLGFYRAGYTSFSVCWLYTTTRPRVRDAQAGKLGRHDF